jgi:hypothetical protein
MNDRPTAPELIAAARQYLEGELIPSLTDARLRYQTLVTANVLSIVERELAGEEEQLRAEWDGLAHVLGLAGPRPERLSALRQAVLDANALLCRSIRAGDFDERGRFLSLSKQLRQSVERKLAIANPRYLASFGKEDAGLRS